MSLLLRFLLYDVSWSIMIRYFKFIAFWVLCELLCVNINQNSTKLLKIHDSRSLVVSGAQFGTVVSMPLSGLLAGSALKWPSIFYVFGVVGTIWSVLFLFLCYESPQVHPRINEDEKRYILSSLWGNGGVSSPPIPWKAIATSFPFWAILLAHMGHNYGYETLMTELPTFMKQVLHFNIKDVSIFFIVF